MTRRHIAFFLLTFACIRVSAAADYSPQVGAVAPKRVLWGDTHLHSGWSVDAGAVGARLGPEEAVRFARGEAVMSTTGQQVRIGRALDFVVVTDHAEGLGLVQALAAQDPTISSSAQGKRWIEMLRSGREQAMRLALELIGATMSRDAAPDFVRNPDLRQSYWQRNTAIQEKYNEPGRFTTLIGYEWSSMRGGDNLHRNLIFRDGKARADRVTPFSALESEAPEDLWQWMQRYELETGGKLLAIPHNGNLSNGRMFALADYHGQTLTRAYAEARARWEPLIEATQMKGDSETHPSLSPNDEFANFERWDRGNLNGKPKTSGMLKSEYARQALKEGLALGTQLGANPFKFGMIGSTDSHTGLTTAEENNFYGKHPLVEPSPRRMQSEVMPGEPAWRMNAAGLAAVWAKENTREAIWDALMRKEVYATTGTRLTVRFFAGYDFAAGDVLRSDWDELGYAKGVPMGGDLPMAPTVKGKTRAPVFMIQAAKDPDGANLDRVQVIKGWLDSRGQVREQIFDVAWSGQGDHSRKRDRHGKLPAVGDTVDVQAASYRNDIGTAYLSAVWRDPAFEAQYPAFYYLRVIEIPTPRWPVYDAKRFGLTLAPEVTTRLQERAYTSPIWYTPAH